MGIPRESVKVGGDINGWRFEGLPRAVDMHKGRHVVVDVRCPSRRHVSTRTLSSLRRGKEMRCRECLAESRPRVGDRRGTWEVVAVAGHNDVRVRCVECGKVTTKSSSALAILTVGCVDCKLEKERALARAGKRHPILGPPADKTIPLPREIAP